MKPQRTTAELALLNKALRELRAAAVLGRVPHANVGICYNLDKLVPQSVGTFLCTYGFVEDFAPGWPQHSGEAGCPVPTTGHRKWEGKSLELRLSLIDYLLEQTE